jgi:hypothetical protein
VTNGSSAERPSLNAWLHFGPGVITPQRHLTLAEPTRTEPGTAIGNVLTRWVQPGYEEICVRSAAELRDRFKIYPVSK